MTPADLRIEVAGVPLVLLAEGGVLLPEVGAVLIGDLHLGRARTMQRAGVGLPSGGDDEDVARVEALARRVDAGRLVLLGDVVHARAGVGAEVAGALRRLANLAPGNVQAVPGNHDGAYLSNVAADSGVTVTAPRIRLGGAELTHTPRTRAPSWQAPLRIAAHLHPAVSLRDGADRVRIPAFLLREARRELIVPAFGSTAAGARFRPSARERLFAATGTEVLEIGAPRVART